MRDGAVRIEQTIYVERESQRKIVLGKGGQAIKAIGAAARDDIAEAIEQPVHLFLHVKVREGWGDDPERYREMGLEIPEGVYQRRHRAMEWIDEGIVLGVKRHGETSVILELMTQAHGRHLGLVRGGAGSRLRGVLQPGNSLRATWRARLDEHLGHYAVEGAQSARRRVSAGRARGARRDPSRRAVPACLPSASRTRDLSRRSKRSSNASTIRRVAAPMIARFELDFLAELGFGLDLSSCAATGATDDLIYVSPKSGRAVSRAAGEAYRDRLMRLPAFLRSEAEPETARRLPMPSR